MALDITVIYPAQCLTGQPGYPYGKARNLTHTGDGTGFPFEARWVNDLFGFLQALLVDAGITPDPLTPVEDRVGASQYLDAVRFIATHPTTPIAAFGTTVGAGGFITANGQFIGTPRNFFTDTTFVGVAEFVGLVEFDDQVQLGKAGAVFGSTFSVFGNGLPGVIIQAGGLQVLVGAANFSDVANFGAAATFSDEVQLLAAGRIRQRIAYTADADEHHNITQADVFVAKSTVSAPRVFTVDDTGASEGSSAEFRNYSSSTHTLHNAGGATIGTVPPVHVISSVGYPGIARLSFENDGSGARWLVVERVAP